ncbi:MAG: M15 family metallopeptidase [Angelakisella sp.]|jgi:D-alanyl-D-alanine dipeptidase/carboxypeptidase|nr:M15 family metallopeptidase [Angelakisella sp.]
MKERILFEREMGTGSLILVNAANPCREAPASGLTEVGGPGSGVQMERRAAILLEELMERLRGWTGIAPVSGWRSLEEQREIWEESMRTKGAEFTRKFVAAPGCSEHHTGLAIDLGERREEIDFICPDFPAGGLCGRFSQMAARYGFVLRYPAGKEAVTGIAHEPWHFRYVGVPHALIMEERGLVLEEYLELLRLHPWGKDPLYCRTQGMEAAVSFLPAGPGGTARLSQREDSPCSISGNNRDGFIITQWNGRLLRRQLEAGRGCAAG